LSASSPLTRLALYGAGSVAIYFAAFTVPYSLEAGLEKPLLHFGSLTGPSLGPTLMLIAAVAGLFALYIAALRLCARIPPSPGAFAVVAGFSVLSAATLIRMYPVFSLDVFYYMAADRIWSIWRENPFVVPPLQAAHDPFFPYTRWGHYPLPYGPTWPWITELTSKFGSGNVLQTLVAFKGLGALGYLICLPLVVWATAAFHPARTLIALCLFAWNPLVVLELVGGAHNDAVALPPAALAVGLWARRATVGAALAGLASLTVKATVGILAPALLWASFLRALRAHRLVIWTATHVLPGLALYWLAWAPFASGGIPPGFLQEADQHYNSLTALLIALLPPAWKDVGVRAIQLVLVGAFGLFYIAQLRPLAVEGLAAVRAMWRIVAVFFLVVWPFYSPWYTVWPTFFAAIMADRRMTTLNTLLCVGALSVYLVQFVVRPFATPALGWAQITALGLLVAVGPFLVGWLLLRHSKDAHSAGAALAGAPSPGASRRPLPRGRGEW
jgi:alpha-1,6-mannosyltransferase